MPMRPPLSLGQALVVVTFSDVKVKVHLPWRDLDLDVNKMTAEYFLAELHGLH